MRGHAKASSAGSISGSGHLLGLLALAVAALLALAVAPASAAVGELGSFAGDGADPGGSGSADGQLSNPGQADVLTSSGKLYVADTANDRVEVFTTTATGGAYDSQVAIPAPTGLAIDQGSGDVYVSNASGVTKFDQTLTPVGTWTDPGVTGSLAVDPSTHDLLIGDQGANLIRRFEADGSAAGSFAVERPVDLAVNSSGEVFVVTSTGNITGVSGAECGPTSTVVRFSASGVAAGTVGPSLVTPGAVAIDPDDDSILVAAHVGEYACEAGFQPEVAFFDATGAAGESVELSGNALYAMVPGLTALGGGSSRAFAVTKSPNNDEFGNTKVVVLGLLSPPVATIDPVDPLAVTATEATFSGSVDPAGKATEWHFEYRPVGSGSWDSTPSEDAGSGAVPVEVSTEASGLQPNLAYEARLVASNSDGSDATDPEGFQTDAALPIVQTEPAGARSDDAARLVGRVNPNNDATTYWFEFGTSTSYGTSVPAGQDADAGSGGSSTEVSLWASGLKPNTTYHYRLVARNSQGTAPGTDRTVSTRPAPVVSAGCPNAAVRAQQGSEYLADCRAYEQMSPVEKYGYPVGGQLQLPVQLSVDAAGDRTTWMGFYPLAGAKTGSYGGWLSERDPAAGWRTTGLLPTPDGVPKVGTLEMPAAALSGATPDQRVSVYFDNTTDPFGALWVVRGDGSRQLIARGQAYQGRNAQLGPWFQGISNDGKHILFTCKCSLVPGVVDSGSDILYEWVDDGANAGEGTLRVVNRTNEPTTTLIDTAPAELGGAGYASSRNTGDFGVGDAVSADGSRIFFQNPAPSFSVLGSTLAPGGPVYLREDGAETVDVSAPSPGYTPTNPPTGFRYMDASHSSADPSVDGRYVFFWADGDLTAGASTSGGIYRYDVVAQTLSFVAQTEVTTGLSSDDGSHFYYQNGASVWVNISGDNRFIRAGGVVGGFRETPSSFSGTSGIEDERCPSANVSPDGRYLAFVAGTGTNSRAYLYDSAAETLDDVSSVPDGPSGAYAVTFMANCGGSPIRPKKSRVMSNDGQHVFFDTTAALVPQDTNDVWDAYEWHNGKVSLLGGTGSFESGFVGTDASGANAFVLSKDRLALTDIDAAADIYVARTGGGFLKTASPQCAGEGCLGQPGTAPAIASAGSASFSGPGNVSARGRKRCEKGRHKAKPRCGKEHRKVRRHKAKQRKSKGQSKRATNQTRRASR